MGNNSRFAAAAAGCTALLLSGCVVAPSFPEDGNFRMRDGR